MKISEHVRTTPTQDGAVLMNIKGGSMLTLNPTGSIIWQQISEGRTATQIAVRLASEFGISEEQACADVNDFVEQLRAQQLIEPDELSRPKTLVGQPIGLFCNLFGSPKSEAAEESSSK